MAKSAVIRLLDLVYAESLKSTGHSWGRLNSAMRNALSIAIGVGFKFSIGDFKHIFTNYKSGYWVGDEVEWWYTKSVSASNMSAIASFETYKGREPFIADRVDQPKCDFSHLTGPRSKERLSVGAQFVWKGDRVRVNSFAPDGSYLNACSYRRTGAFTKKVAKRFKITRQDIISDRAARKLAAKKTEAS